MSGGLDWEVGLQVGSGWERILKRGETRSGWKVVTQEMVTLHPNSTFQFNQESPFSLSKSFHK